MAATGAVVAAVVLAVLLATGGDSGTDSGNAGNDSGNAGNDRPASPPPEPAPARKPAAVTSWPRRDAYTAIIYVSPSNRAAARDRARRAARLGYRAGVFRSGDYPNFPPGRFVGFAGVYDDRGRALAAAARLKRQGVAASPYVRRVKGASGR